MKLDECCINTGNPCGEDTIVDGGICRCAPCVAFYAKHGMKPKPTGGEPLVVSAEAGGRTVVVHTYSDGTAKQFARLLFHDAEDAAECARVLTAARKPRRIVSCKACGWPTEPWSDPTMGRRCTNVGCDGTKR